MNAATLALPGPRATQPLTEVVHALLHAAWRRRYLIILPVLVLPVVGAAIGSVAPRSYEARMSVLVQDPSRFNPFMNDLTVRSNLRDRMDALRALLTSRHVLLGVAEDIGMIAPGASEAAQGWAVSSLAGAVSVTLIGQEMVELRYRARRPDGMDEVLRRIGERFIERVRGPEDTSLRESVAFLERHAGEAQAELDAAEAALAGFKSGNAAQLPDLRQANVNRLAVLREQLAEREVRLAGAEGEIASMRARLLQTDPVIGRVETDIVTATGDLALLRARYTTAHSRVQAAERRLERLEEERGALLRAAARNAPLDPARLWNLAAVAPGAGDGAQPLLVSQVGALEAARTRVEQLRAETANLRASAAELAARVAASGEVERGLRGLERDVAVKAELLQALRRRYEQARVTADLAQQQAPERIKIIDRPLQPSAPTRPMTMLFAIAGLAAGIALGVGLAALLEITDTSVRRIRDLERLTGVPVLARIPRYAATAR
jgi:polysaccharide chain length determinant protein (PEP-CTERM system associated)